MKYSLHILAYVSLLLLSLLTFSDEFKSKEHRKIQRPKITIVIDDLGYSMKKAKQFNRLPYPLTFAVIPDAPFAQKIANLITNSNHKRHELILHIPMEPLDYTHSKNGLLRSHSRPEFEQQLNYMLNNYPHIKGVNNHRGSLLTADTEKMTWLMNTLSTKKLYFLDSRTTAQSKAISAAKKANIPHISRDIFLDHQKDNAFIEHAFEQLRYTAKKYGHAVAIGHPYPLTLKKLEEELPKLIEEGFELTIGSQLAEVQKHGAML